MASPTQWTWVWVNSGSWWWTRRPGVLWFMVSQRVGHDWVTELIDWNGHMKTRVKPSFTFKFSVWKTMSVIFSEYINNYNTKKKEKKNCIAPMCMLSHFSHHRLCNPANYSPPGFSVRGILQAGILEWIAMPSSRGSWPGLEPASLLFPALAGGFFTTTTTREAQFLCGWTASSDCELPSQILRLYLFLILLCIRYFFYRFALDISYFLQFKWSTEFCYKFSWITL